VEPATHSRARRLIGHLAWPALLMVGAVGWLNFQDHVENDPAFCGRCHHMQPAYSLWTRNQHRDLRCQECHHQTHGEALEALLGYISQGQAATTGRNHARVEPDDCARCHLSHDRRWPQVSDSAGHGIHVRDAGLSCLRCHARAIHSYESPADLCSDCHAETPPDAMGEAHCLACHDFLGHGEDLAPSRGQCLECHTSGAQLATRFPDDAPMAELPCAACHRPHAEPASAQVPCVHCHEALDPLHEAAGHERCGDCHRPHTWAARSRDCLRCHSAQASHYRHAPCSRCHTFRPEEVPP
jgi:hypothetical protein